MQITYTSLAILAFCLVVQCPPPPPDQLDLLAMALSGEMADDREDLVKVADIEPILPQMAPPNDDNSAPSDAAKADDLGGKDWEVDEFDIKDMPADDKVDEWEVMQLPVMHNNEGLLRDSEGVTAEEGTDARRQVEQELAEIAHGWEADLAKDVVEAVEKSESKDHPLPLSKDTAQIQIFNTDDFDDNHDDVDAGTPIMPLT